MDLNEAYKHVRRVAVRHYENFPVGSLLLPADIRNSVYAIYAFARTADDFADEIGDKNESMRKLGEWRGYLNDAVSGNPPDHPVFVALADTIKNKKLDIKLLTDLLDAFEQDVKNPPYKTWEEVINYCRKSANPIGRLLLQLFKIESRDAMQYSDSLCSGLQLINFWQDLSLDIADGRCYIPEELFPNSFDNCVKEIADTDTEFKEKLLFAILEKTEELYREGKKLFPFLSGRIRWEIKLTYYGGYRILEKIKKTGTDIFNSRPRLTKSDWLSVIYRSAID